MSQLPLRISFTLGAEIAKGEDLAHSHVLVDGAATRQAVSASGEDLAHVHELEPEVPTYVAAGEDLAHVHVLDTTSISIIPVRPPNFEAERKNSYQDTELTWDAVSAADEYVISRAEHYRERYVELARVQSGTTTYTDNHGNPDQRYSYRIYAVHLYGGKSPRSPAVHVKGSQSEL